MAQCQPIEAKDTINNGVRDMPWVKTPIYYVDQASIADFVCSHDYWLNIDEVYKNVPDKKPDVQMIASAHERSADAVAGKGGAKLLAVRSLTKVFPGVVAVDNVDFDIAPGEIVALLGQNGAGKSTLIQVLSGLYPYRHLFRGDRPSTARRSDAIRSPRRRPPEWRSWPRR